MERTIRIYILPLLIFFMASCSQKEEVAIAKDPTPVQVSEIRLVDKPHIHTYPAFVRAGKEVQLSTRLMGEILLLNVSEGQQVMKGQVLARIDSRDLEAKKSLIQATLSEAEAQKRNTEINYERISALHKRGSATQKELDDIIMQIEVAQSRVIAIENNLKEISESLRYAKIIAPFDGKITRKFMQAGDLARPGAPIILLENNRSFEILARIPESEIKHVTPGKEVELEISAAGKSYAGIINLINPSSIQTGSQFEVIIDFKDSPGAMVRSGMFVKVRLEGTPKPRILIPEEAIVTKGQLEGVFTVSTAAEAMLRWVRLGKKVDGYREVLSGLQEGDQLIIDYKGKLVDGQSVLVNNESTNKL